jgi:APA family basic amino acid/polyamine antiporter
LSERIFEAHPVTDAPVGVRPVTTTAKLGFWSGVGLVVANMVGAGVFLSAGFMAQDLGPLALMGAWVVGAILAMAGARAYAELALAVPRSGGEYRILSDLLHPALGYLAGWTSLLLGFSGPIAIAAIAAGAFLQTLIPAASAKLTAAVVIVLVTVLHAFNHRVSHRTQNALVVVKVALVLGIVVVGLALGSHEMPRWSPPNALSGFPLAAFMSSLFYVSFAFSGWNAAIYSSEEFENPRRSVPRIMLVGCALVSVLYLIINWVFVANLTPERATVVFAYEEKRITLGHLVALDLLGTTGGQIVSAAMVVGFVSAVSAMTFAGPRVYASMAADGFLPKALKARTGRPPVGSVLLQGALSLVLVFLQKVSAILLNVSAILVMFAALTAASLFVLRFRPGATFRPRPASLLAAGIFTTFSAWMLYFAFRSSTHLLGWLAAVFAVALVAYVMTRLRVSSRSPATGKDRSPRDVAAPPLP